MDSGRLFSILIDIEEEYKRLRLANLINLLKRGHNVKKQYSTGAVLKAVEFEAENSIVNDYGISDSNILETIGGSKFLGHGLKKKLTNLMAQHQFDSSELKFQLNSLLIDRHIFLKNCHESILHLEKLNIKPHKQGVESYEFGIYIQEDSKFTELKELEKLFKNWNFVFKTLSELTANDYSEPKISYVNNGSIEFYLSHSFEIAFALGYITDKLVKVYSSITKIREHRKELEKLGVPKLESKTIEKHEKKILEEQLKSAENGILEEHKNNIIKGREKELKVAISKSIKFIAKSVDQGIQIEIIPPRIESSSNTSDEKNYSNEQQLLELKRRKKKMAIIQESNNIFKNLTSSGKEIFKLITGEEEE